MEKIKVYNKGFLWVIKDLINALLNNKGEILWMALLSVVLTVAVFLFDYFVFVNNSITLLNMTEIEHFLSDLLCATISAYSIFYAFIIKYFALKADDNTMPINQIPSLFTIEILVIIVGFIFANISEILDNVIVEYVAFFVSVFATISIMNIVLHFFALRTIFIAEHERQKHIPEH